MSEKECVFVIERKSVSLRVCVTESKKRKESEIVRVCDRKGERERV